MSATVSEVDIRAADRMANLADSLQGEVERLRWADVDLRRAFNTEKIALAYAVRREGGYVPQSVDRIDKIRNMMVLLPILLTWFALFEASRTYRKYIDANPEEIRKPFLLLWEEGFGGTSPFFSPTFSTVALADAIIIAVIIFLTFLSHGRRDSREDAIQKTANAFQTELDNTLAEATVELAPDRAGRPAMLARSVDRLATRFENSSQELLIRLKAEHDRLASIADRREREIADFGVFASGMRAGAEETHRLLLDLRQVSGGLRQTLDDLSGEIALSGDYQQSLQATIGSLERTMAASIQADSAVTNQLSDAAAALAGAADRSISAADTAANAGRVAAEAVHGIAEITSTLANSQFNLEQSLSAQTNVNAELADALRSGATGVSSSSRTMGDVARTMSELRDEFDRMGMLAQEQTATFGRMLSEQNTMASSLSDVARDMSSASTATSMRQREMNDNTVALIRRLDNLAATLNALASDSGDTSWLKGTVEGEPQSSDTEPATRSGRSIWPSRK